MDGYIILKLSAPTQSHTCSLWRCDIPVTTISTEKSLRKRMGWCYRKEQTWWGTSAFDKGAAIVCQPCYRSTEPSRRVASRSCHHQIFDIIPSISCHHQRMKNQRRSDHHYFIEYLRSLLYSLGVHRTQIPQYWLWAKLSYGRIFSTFGAIIRRNSP